MARDSAEQLLIALEPEAASIYCRKLRLHQVLDLSQRPMTNGLDQDGSRPFDSSFRQGTGPLLTLLFFKMLLLMINMIVQRALQAKLQHSKADPFAALTWDAKHLQGLGNQDGLSSHGGVVVF